ncbi:hypothetical protein HU200_017516 [Digitaria exilis]|uniref:RING-type domain-containing protein n=1 Tax=Digitaria exilis TaxID=1010633 RepID=A0A835F682_9POAL|nr:hypothetical protein HU200_017516 [Digitaria exilis]
MAGLTLSVLLLVAGVVAMLVLHILIVFWALRRGAVASQPDEEMSAAAADAAGLSAEDLDGMPCHEHAGSKAGGECAVCLEAFQDGDRCRALPGCEHRFHAQCVDPWLRKSRVCPFCRAEVVAVGRGKAAGKVAGDGEAAASSEIHILSSRPAAAAALALFGCTSSRVRDQLFWLGCMAGTHSVVFLVTGFAMVLVVHVLVLFWALNWCCRAQPSSRVGEREEEGGGAAGLSAEQVDELPCRECKEGPGGGGECAVCLEAFRAGERCRVLPGGEHGFHAECVDSWLRKSRRCPICRAEVVVVAAGGQGKSAGGVAEPTAVEIVVVTER